MLINLWLYANKLSYYTPPKFTSYLLIIEKLATSFKHTVKVFTYIFCKPYI